MRLITAVVFCVITGLMSPALASETYDLIFKNGTLDDIPKEDTIVYARDVILQSDLEAAQAATGLVELSFVEDDIANLQFFQGGKHKSLGRFPADVGNPMIMYFVETVVRDMAQHAGGSPFYIRNRVKESLVKFAEIESKTVELDGADIEAQQITLRPFLNDKNSEKMRGYGEMSLTITMSDDVPGWYYSLVASVQGNGASPIYKNAVTFTEAGK